MKSVLHRLFIAALGCAALVRSSPAVEPGFIPLLDSNHTDGWKQFGSGGMNIQDGVATTWVPPKANPVCGWYCYSKRTFADFTLKLEFKAEGKLSNSGVLVRSLLQGDEIFNQNMRSDQGMGYEVNIAGDLKDPWPTGAIVFFQRPSMVPQKAKDWNEMEITIIGQKQIIKLNGEVVNEFLGNRGTDGYIALQNWRPSIQFRNIRIKDLSVPQRLIALSHDAAAAEPNQPLLETLSQQAPNAGAWVLAPLDAAVPPDIRQNLTYLREDMLDEAAKKPKASPESYKLAEQLCETMIAVLDERDRALARAGFRAVEANARTGVTSQALEARRNYKMSWPQFARENAQRAELKSQAVNSAAIIAERPKLEWSNRADQIRPVLDTLYKQFREALRQLHLPK